MRTSLLSLLCVAGLASAQCPTWVGRTAAYPVGTVVTYGSSNYTVVRTLDNGWIAPTDTWFWATTTATCATTPAPAPTPAPKAQAYEARFQNLFVTIEGTKQGRFKGESILDAQRAKIEASSLQHNLLSPRDIATGLPSGKRQHSAITLTKAWGASSPQIFQAWATAELLKTILIEIPMIAPDGETVIAATIKLTNAYVSQIVRRTEASGKLVEDVSFTYRSIELEDKLGKTIAFDDWSK